MNDLICPLCEIAVIEHEFVDNGYVCYGNTDEEDPKAKVLDWLEKINDREHESS